MPSPDRPCLSVETRGYEKKLSSKIVPPTLITNGLTTVSRNIRGRLGMVKDVSVGSHVSRQGSRFRLRVMIPCRVRWFYTCGRDSASRQRAHCGRGIPDLGEGDPSGDDGVERPA